MANLQHIDMNGVDIGPDAGSGFDLLPEGKYSAMVTESKLIPTKGTYQPEPGAKPVPKGWILELTWQILSGPHERRLVWDKITLIHTSADAQRIGRETWKKACRAAGISYAPQDSSEIHNKLVRIQVKTKPASNGYEASNAVKAYYSAPAQAAPIQGEPQAGHQPTGQASPPWGGAAGNPPF